jgi:hypothetical protein
MQEAPVGLHDAVRKAAEPSPDAEQLAEEAVLTVSSCLSEAAPVAFRISQTPELNKAAEAEELLARVRHLLPDPTPDAAYEALSDAPVDEVLPTLTLVNSLAEEIEEGELAQSGWGPNRQGRAGWVWLDAMSGKPAKTHADRPPELVWLASRLLAARALLVP